MGLFDVNEDKLKGYYHRAWNEADRGAVNPRDVPYLDKSLRMYAKENGCSYDEAVRIAKGKK